MTNSTDKLEAIAVHADLWPEEQTTIRNAAELVRASAAYQAVPTSHNKARFNDALAKLQETGE